MKGPQNISSKKNFLGNPTNTGYHDNKRWLPLQQTLVTITTNTGYHKNKH
jgi:hypothetical protein